MKATVVGLVTPHVLKLIDLARQAETGANVDWHVRDAAARTLRELGEQFNARELLVAYVKGLQSAIQDAGTRRAPAYVAALQTAFQLAVRELAKLD